MLSQLAMSDSVTPCTVARQAPLSMGFSRGEYWSRLPYPTARELPNPGIEPEPPTAPGLAVGFFTTVLPARHKSDCTYMRYLESSN